MNKDSRIKVLIQIRDLRIGNGIAACLMNYYEYTIQNGIVIDFLLNADIESPYRNRVLAGGSTLYVMPHNTSKPNRENDAYIRTVLAKGYDILHVNTSGYYALSSLKSAKKLGIKTRIYHAHNPKEPLSLKVAIRNKLYVEPSVKYANKYAACSKHAGNSVFDGKNFTVIHNAMDTSKYRYDESKRKEIRKELCVEDAYVVGTVGRMEDQKNPFFLLEIFNEFLKLKPEAVLVWAGDGSMKNSLKSKIDEYGIGEHVRLLGTRTDVAKLYSAMDMFLLPSKFEGLGLVFVEAQISGLPCFGSDKVPEDVEITQAVHRVELAKPASLWAEIMNSVSNEIRVTDNKVQKCGFDITTESLALVELYKAGV